MVRAALLAVILDLIISPALNAAEPDDRPCELIRVALRNSIETIILLEMQNFNLKKDSAYDQNYSAYYDEALSHFNTKALVRAMEAVSDRCLL